MYVWCPRCGAETDLDAFHEVEGMTFDQAFAAFQRRGCHVFGGGMCLLPRNRSRAELARVIYATIGDDPDGCAAEFEDYSIFELDSE